MSEIHAREAKISNEEAIRSKTLKEVGNHGNNIRFLIRRLRQKWINVCTIFTSIRHCVQSRYEPS